MNAPQVPLQDGPSVQTRMNEIGRVPPPEAHFSLPKVILGVGFIRKKPSKPSLLSYFINVLPKEGL
jgi:hypothetical protein